MMTEEEYIEKSQGISKEIQTIRGELYKKQNERRKIMHEYADFLTEKYYSYIDCLVRFNSGYATHEGFFKGFKYESDTGAINPVITKIKKNGQASLSTYSSYTVPSYKKDDWRITFVDKKN